MQSGISGSHPHPHPPATRAGNGGVHAIGWVRASIVRFPVRELNSHFLSDEYSQWSSSRPPSSSCTLSLPIFTVTVVGADRKCDCVTSQDMPVRAHG